MCYQGSDLVGLLKQSLDNSSLELSHQKVRGAGVFIYSDHCLKAASAGWISSTLAYFMSAVQPFQSIRESPRQRGTDKGSWVSAEEYLSDQAQWILAGHTSQFFPS